MNRSLQFTATLIIALTLLGGSARADALVDAVNKAMKGTETKKLKVDSHEFNILPITVVRSDKGKVATGTVSHHLTGKPDDQISYKIVIKPGEENQVTVSIREGGLGKFIPVHGAWAKKLGQLVHGDWQPSVQKIINVIEATLELE